MGGLYYYWRKAITWFMLAFLRIRVESPSSNYHNTLLQQGQVLHYENGYCSCNSSFKLPNNVLSR